MHFLRDLSISFCTLPRGSVDSKFWPSSMPLKGSKRAGPASSIKDLTPDGFGRDPAFEGVE
eukprot:7045422-Alexandrium_andersonii.AAC.1